MRPARYLLRGDVSRHEQVLYEGGHCHRGLGGGRIPIQSRQKVFRRRLPEIRLSSPVCLRSARDSALKVSAFPPITG